MKFREAWISQPKTVFLTAALFYLLIAFASGFLGWRNPDCGWIVAVASRLFTLDPYSHYRLISIAPPLGQGFSSPPLLLFLIAPFIILGQNFGWTNDFMAKIYQAPLHLIDILNIYLIIKIAREYRPRISKLNLNLTILILFFSGYFLFASGFMGHPETLVLLFSLLGIKFLRYKKLLLSGIFFGLALLAKQAAIFILIPIFFYLLFAKDGFRHALRFGVGVAFAFLLVISPLFIANPADTWYGIVEGNRRLIIRGPNIWWLIESFSRRILNLSGASQVLIKIANPILFGVIILLSIIFLSRKKFKIEDSSLFGLISASLLLSSIFAKWVSFHHFLLPVVFIILWDTIRSREGFPAFGVSYAFALLAANFIGNPFWQLMILVINMGAFAYLSYSLVLLK